MQKLYTICVKKLILIALGAIVVLFAAYLLLSRPNQTQQTSTTSKEEAGSKTGTQETIILSGLAEALELKPELRDYMYMDWLDENKQPLPLTGSQFIVGTVNINGIGKYKAIPENDLAKITLTNLSPLLTTADTYFIGQGFTKNSLNTRIISDPPIQTAFYGYEKGQLKCVIRIDEQTDPFGNFVCGTIDTQQEALQNEFRSLFTGAKANMDGITITSYRVQKVEGNFALGSANGNIMGYTWMAKKVNGTWQIVWRGNDIALCSEMIKQGIPKSIYGNCYDPSAQPDM